MFIITHGRAGPPSGGGGGGWVFQVGVIFVTHLHVMAVLERVKYEVS